MFDDQRVGHPCLNLLFSLHSVMQTHLVDWVLLILISSCIFVMWGHMKRTWGWTCMTELESSVLEWAQSLGSSVPTSLQDNTLNTTEASSMLLQSMLCRFFSFQSAAMSMQTILQPLLAAECLEARRQDQLPYAAVDSRLTHRHHVYWFNPHPPSSSWFFFHDLPLFHTCSPDG